MPWFSRRADSVAPVGGADQLDAYKEGRRDENARLKNDPAAVDKSALDAAYDRGRHDERLRRRGSPLLGFLVLLVAIVGGIIIYLAVRDRSFTAAGASVDKSISTTAQTVEAPVRGAADKTGTALENAGQNLKNRAGSGPNANPP
jgi:hypothetical protein